MKRLCLVSLLLVVFMTTAMAQKPAAPNSATVETAKAKPEKDPEAERLVRERRENAQSLLISLAADAAKFNDQTLRARTQARIADVLWSADPERARTMFRAAWDAAETVDAQNRQVTLEEIKQQQAKQGNVATAGRTSIRNEILRLAAKHDRALGEEFLTKLKTEKEQEAKAAVDSHRSDRFNSPEAMNQRLMLARQLLDVDVERAIQFADPALGSITMETLNFLSYLREKDAAAADRRYEGMLGMAAASLQSDANTVSLLSSYIFTPHLFIMFEGAGGTNSSSSGPNHLPIDAPPQLRAAFFNTAAQILLRPQAPPGEDQSSSGAEGKYLVMKRLLPLFEQLAPREIAEAVRAQMEALGGSMSNDLRQRDDEPLREGIRPQKADADRLQNILDKIDHAETAEERDQLYLELASIAAESMDPKARDYAAKIADDDLRKQVAPFIDARLMMRAVDKKDADRLLDAVRIGELTHFQKAWALSRAARFLAKTDPEKASSLIEEATEEARRIDVSDADRPRALLAVADAILIVDRSKLWDLMSEITRAANSAENFTGEDGVMRVRLITKEMSSIHSTSVGEFDLRGVFSELAREDYNRTIELARLFEREAPRATATIAIARTVFEEKKK